MARRINVSSESLAKKEQERKSAEQGVALAEKIAALIVSEEVPVSVAELALRRAATIVRARTVVNFTRL